MFAKGFVPNWNEEVFMIKKIKNNDLNGEEISGTFYEKALQKTNKTQFRFGKVIKRKGDKLYVKCKGCDNSFNSRINNQDIVI